MRNSNDGGKNIICKSKTAITFFVIFSFSFLSFHCSSSKDVSAKKGKSVREYEKDFDPVKYGTIKSKNPETTKNKASELTAKDGRISTERVGKISGFRVQIFSTADVDEAMLKRDLAQSTLDSSKIYVVYDAPYYKIRVGDFLTHDAANSMKMILKEKGYNEAWIVPDQVLHTVLDDK